MFSFKEMLSKVQNGLANNLQLKETLFNTQKVTSFRDNPKSKVVDTLNFKTGSKILDKFGKDWEVIHNISQENAESADKVYKLLEKIHKHTDMKLKQGLKLCNELQNIANISDQLDQCMQCITGVHISIQNLEHEMDVLENLVDEEVTSRRKIEYMFQLNAYRDQKLDELQNVRSQLDKNSKEENALREYKEQTERRKRQIESQEAFNEDINRFMRTGIVPLGSRANKETSLEDIVLKDEEGQLESFLNS